MRALTTATITKQATPAMRPMSSAGAGSTKPEPGVIATRPATAPEMRPRSEGLPRVFHSTAIQARAPAAAAICVTRIAITARPSAARPEPPLKPIQPNQSRQAPIMASERFAGARCCTP